MHFKKIKVHLEHYLKIQKIKLIMTVVLVQQKVKNLDQF